MAKSKKADKDPHREHLDAVRRHLLDTDLNQPELCLGDHSYIDVGIPIPLILQYFFNVQGLPLGLVYQLTGSEGNRKTTFLMELFRLVGRQGGMGYFALTEGKYSQSLAGSICGYPDEPNCVPIQPFTSDNMQRWQSYISANVRRVNEVMDKGFTQGGKKFPPGLYAPQIFGVDSLVAQLTQTQAEEVEKQGGRERGFATHVKSLSEWISQIQASIANRPYVVALINHCEINQVTQYQVEVKQKGGRKLAYESSVIIFVKATAPTFVMYQKEGWAPQEVRTNLVLELKKSSIGAAYNPIVVPLVERTEIVGVGDSRQRTWFMWGKALVDFLMCRMYETESGYRFKQGMATKAAYVWYREKIKEVVDFKRDPKNKDYYFCDKYVPDGQSVSAQKLGELLSADREFVIRFQEIFGIKPTTVWTGGSSNYVDVAREVRERMYLQRTSIPTKVE